jgi:hypothetical protein
MTLLIDNPVIELKVINHSGRYLNQMLRISVFHEMVKCVLIHKFHSFLTTFTESWPIKKLFKFIENYSQIKLKSNK